MRRLLPFFDFIKQNPHLFYIQPEKSPSLLMGEDGFFVVSDALGQKHENISFDALRPVICSIFACYGVQNMYNLVKSAFSPKTSTALKHKEKRHFSMPLPW